MSTSRMTRAFSALLAMVTFASVSALWTPAPARAQTPPGAASVSVSPPTTELDAQPGETVTRRVSVINGSDSERRFNASTKNFAPAGESGEAALSDDENPFSLKEYIGISPSSANIGPSQTQDFTVTIKLPNDVGPGSRYGAVVFTPVPTSDPNANLEVVSEVSSLFLVRVPGQANEKLNIVSFESHQFTTQDGREVVGEKQGFFQEGPVNFSLRLQNQGNIGLKPTARVVIKNIFGSTVETIEAPPQNVLPNSIRKYDIKWNHDQLFGRYTAEVEVTYGATTQRLTSSTSFWGAPLTTIGIVLAVLVLLFLLLWLPRKRLKAAFRALKSGGATEPAPQRPTTTSNVTTPLDDNAEGQRFRDDGDVETTTTQVPPEHHDETDGHNRP